MRRKYLAWALLCANCGGDKFSAAERETASDGGLGDKPAVGVTSEGSDGSSVVQDGGGAPFVGGSGGRNGVWKDSGGSSDGSSSADGSSGSSSGGSGGASDGGVTCTTGETRCSVRQPQVCISNFWLDDGPSCSHCLNAICVSCSPGAEQCSGGHTPMTCTETGRWVADTDVARLFTHDNGLGQTWQDCMPLGTYDVPQARKACEAWCEAVGCASSNGISDRCGAETICDGYLTIRGTAGDTSMAWLWSYEPPVDPSIVWSIDTLGDCTSAGTWR